MAYDLYERVGNDLMQLVLPAGSPLPDDVNHLSWRKLCRIDHATPTRESKIEQDGYGPDDVGAGSGAAADPQNLQILYREIEAARVEATLLGDLAFQEFLTLSLLVVEEELAKVGDAHARTTPQIEALKRLIRAT